MEESIKRSYFEITLNIVRVRSVQRIKEQKYNLKIKSTSIAAMFS